MRILDFLDIDAISIHSPAKTAEEIITDLGTRLYKLGKVKDNFISATLKREADMPTGLPLGGEINAAIPHVDIEYVNYSALALATLEQPVIFRNMVDRNRPRGTSQGSCHRRGRTGRSTASWCAAWRPSNGEVARATRL